MTAIDTNATSKKFGPPKFLAKMMSVASYPKASWSPVKVAEWDIFGHFDNAVRAIRW